MSATVLRRLIIGLWQQKGALKLTDLLQSSGTVNSSRADFKLYLERTLFLIRYLLFFLTAFFLSDCFYNSPPSDKVWCCFCPATSNRSGTESLSYH